MKRWPTIEVEAGWIIRERAGGRAEWPNEYLHINIWARSGEGIDTSLFCSALK
jgi:hypothetical protein